MAHWVFAYGSNMHAGDLSCFLRARRLSPGVLHRALAAALPGWRLVWNYYSEARAGGAANVERLEGAASEPGGGFETAEVFGVALEVDDVLLAGIDQKEGHPHRYRRERVRAVLRTGELVDSWVYAVQPAYLGEGLILPRAEYVALMLEAAESHELPGHYLSRLRSLLR